MEDFKNIENKINIEEKAKNYLKFVEAVKNLKLEIDINNLREKDRYLWGRSLYNQVKKEIEILNSRTK